MTLLVFLVEDDPAIRVSLMETMTSLLDVQFVGTEQSEPGALNWLAGHSGQWDLAVVDLFIQEGTGFAVIASMNRASKTGNIVALTNSATPENRAHATFCGADAVFDKTAELTEFLEYCEHIG